MKTLRTYSTNTENNFIWTCNT